MLIDFFLESLGGLLIIIDARRLVSSNKDRNNSRQGVCSKNECAKSGCRLKQRK